MSLMHAPTPGNHPIGARLACDSYSVTAFNVLFGTAPNEPWLRCRIDWSSGQASMAGFPFGNVSGSGRAEGKTSNESVIDACRCS